MSGIGIHTLQPSITLHRCFPAAPDIQDCLFHKIVQPYQYPEQFMPFQCLRDPGWSVSRASQSCQDPCDINVVLGVFVCGLNLSQIITLSRLRFRKPATRIPLLYHLEFSKIASQMYTVVQTTTNWIFDRIHSKFKSNIERSALLRFGLLCIYVLHQSQTIHTVMRLS